MTGIKIWFSQRTHPRLERTLFWRENGSPIIAVQSKASECPDSYATFTWNRATLALSILLVRYKIIHEKMQHDQHHAILLGGFGTAAGILNDSLQQRHQWLVDMFGVDSLNIPFAWALFTASRVGWRHDDMVQISVNPKLITSGNINVFSHSMELHSNDELCGLLSELEKQWKEATPYDSLPFIAHRLTQGANRHSELNSD